MLLQLGNISLSGIASLIYSFNNNFVKAQ
jgi:hypothetical protein